MAEVPTFQVFYASSLGQSASTTGSIQPPLLFEQYQHFEAFMASTEWGSQQASSMTITHLGFHGSYTTVSYPLFGFSILVPPFI